ncbi:MAG TPA: DHA2 family efflux MFS transporter permease subunit [Caulobacteraceae bacterium]|nr:DHA2 family efflux MFS transporter permease subunit [Caulobacteraceae bacterium]
MQSTVVERPVTLATWLGFSMMGLAMFMAVLDVQVVATSLPTIQHALAMRPDQMSWIQTAYLIAEVIAIPLTGLLTRALTMRWLTVAAVGLFTLASAGCAASGRFEVLIAWRVVQGLAGGTLIPAVFSAVFLLFPFRLQGVATTIAGVLAVLAPTLGPIVGGWLTQTWSWHWLFLINIAPGIIAAFGAAAFLPADAPDPKAIRHLDFFALALMALSLAALEIALKDAPGHGWTSFPILALLVAAAIGGAGFVRRSLGPGAPVVELRTLADPTFAIGCALSFVLGAGLFGSVYMMPMFLAFVRGHGALEIGEIMLVTGAAQLVAAPLAVALERRTDARVLTAFGFLVFGVGLGLSAFQTPDTDFSAMIVPQAVRGVGIMFCLLPPTRLALGRLTPVEVPDASSLFNLMRNLGGAIGLALIDTVIFSRAPVHARHLIARLQAGDDAAAQAVGIPLMLYHARPAGPVDASTLAMLKPMVEHLAMTRAINEAWAMVAILTLAALLAVPFARESRPHLPPKDPKP